MTRQHTQHAIGRMLAMFGMAAMFITGDALAQNFLENASFEVEGPNGSFTIFTGAGSGGNSAADRWGVFNNTDGTTITELATSSLEGGGDWMLRVFTDGDANGVVQVFLPFDTGPGCVVSSVAVYVESGQVCIGSGNGGEAGCNGFSSTTGQWERIEGTNFSCPANEVIIYSAWGSGGADFFVDLASVVTYDCNAPGDTNADGNVNITDLLNVLGNWGPCPDPCPPICMADLNDDCLVNITDLITVIGNWGCGP